MFLLEGESSITPVWPPCLKYDGYRINRNTDMYYVVNTNNEDPTIFTYDGLDPLPILSKADNVSDAYMSKVKIDDNGKLINIERKVISNGSYVKK